MSTVGECEASAMLPLECQYLNKSALTTLVGPLTPPVKHFQLKRKPKSATLRAELLQKCKLHTAWIMIQFSQLYTGSKRWLYLFTYL